MKPRVNSKYGYAKGVAEKDISAEGVTERSIQTRKNEERNKSS